MVAPNVRDESSPLEFMRGLNEVSHGEAKPNEGLTVAMPIQEFNPDESKAVCENWQGGVPETKGIVDRLT